MATDHFFRAGDVIDQRFLLCEKLGKGAFGSVWRAEDRQASDRVIAIKLLFEKYRQNRKMLARFIQEAKIQERLSHPSIAKSLGYAADGDVVYLAMEYIQGETLDKKCDTHSEERSPIPKKGLAWMCDQLGSALDYAHRHNVVHRDLKPRNVMVNARHQRAFVKVLDFGIAKILVGSELDPTTVGRVLGSVLYISPEQVLSQPLDHRADIFSLGTIMFELITLRRAWARDPSGAPHPFHIPIAGGENNSHVAVLRRIAREARPSASEYREDISPEVDKVLHRAMAIRPDERFRSAPDLAKALRMALLAEPGRASVPSLQSNTVPESVSGRTPTPRAPSPVSETFEETPTYALPALREPDESKTHLQAKLQQLPSRDLEISETDADTVAPPVVASPTIRTPIASDISVPGRRLLVVALIGVLGAAATLIYLLAELT